MRAPKQLQPVAATLDAARLDLALRVHHAQCVAVEVGDTRPPGWCHRTGSAGGVVRFDMTLVNPSRGDR